MLPLLLACAPSQPPPLAAPDIVLVSLDTTRADAIDAETTPNLWALATRGARFTAAFAHAPTTLNSHASVWTGEDPHGHRVPRNGYALATEIPALPERLSAAGYDTLGVIGASALARPMGMDRGFRLWDEKLTKRHEKRFEARAADVTDRALALLAQRDTAKRAFLFVHYYDAHAPYDAPAPWTTKGSDPAYGGAFDGSRAAMQAVAQASRDGTLTAADTAAVRARYRGEVSYIDAELGRLLAATKDPYVVVFGDHGEALGDVAGLPWGHGPDVDAQATHVPLIVAGPGVPATVIDTPVALSDVGATVLGLTGMTGGLGQGRDLAGYWNGAPPAARTVLLEATQPHAGEYTSGWNNLLFERGVVDGDWLYLVSPIRGVGGEVTTWRGTTAPDAALVGTLAERLGAWDASAPPFRPDAADEGTKEGLKALGYLE